MVKRHKQVAAVSSYPNNVTALFPTTSTYYTFMNVCGVYECVLPRIQLLFAYNEDSHSRREQIKEIYDK